MSKPPKKEQTAWEKKIQELEEKYGMKEMDLPPNWAEVILPPPASPSEKKKA